MAAGILGVPKRTVKVPMGRLDPRQVRMPSGLLTARDFFIIRAPGNKVMLFAPGPGLRAGYRKASRCKAIGEYLCTLCLKVVVNNTGFRKAKS
jgi:hypothetical protein